MTKEQMRKNNEGAVRDYKRAIESARRAGLTRKVELLERDLAYYEKMLKACK